MALVNAQVEATEAQADKARAEAENIRGVQTRSLTAQAISTELENEYKKLTGLENRAAQEAANIYNTKMDAKIKELNIEQMPTYLQNDVKRVLLEGQKVAIMAKEADTHLNNAVNKDTLIQ